MKPDWRMGKLIVGPLQKGRINRNDRMEIVEGQSASHRQSVFFIDANVEGTIREGVESVFEVAALDHGGNSL